MPPGSLARRFLSPELRTPTPPLLIRHVQQFGALQQTLVALAVKFAKVPRIPRRQRLEIKELSDGFWQITAHFGFVQVPDLYAALRQAKESGCAIDLYKIPGSRSAMWRFFKRHNVTFKKKPARGGAGARGPGASAPALDARTGHV